MQCCAVHALLSTDQNTFLMEKLTVHSKRTKFCESQRVESYLFAAKNHANIVLNPSETRGGLKKRKFVNIIESFAQI